VIDLFDMSEKYPSVMSVESVVSTLQAMDWAA
jgi:hypothetical protein